MGGLIGKRFLNMSKENPNENQEPVGSELGKGEETWLISLLMHTVKKLEF